MKQHRSKVDAAQRMRAARGSRETTRAEELARLERQLGRARATIDGLLQALPSLHRRAEALQAENARLRERLRRLEADNSAGTGWLFRSTRPTQTG